MRALLDINVLLALSDEQHDHFQLAHSWLQENISQGIATCPLTQNGFLRIFTQGSYPRRRDMATALDMLRRFTGEPFHRFWPDSVSIADVKLFDLSDLFTHRHITDSYLLGLAVCNDGRFVTLDRGVRTETVKPFEPTRLVMIA